ncbi:SMR family transporter [Sulfurovum sp. ST-21]|uniref:EamA family transporter n=1 Tax=Sulfurovum indicum TaxID=2779528 RepID=A0A7M1S4U3_9BACT|nr:EamA family transporter [Sulfurovum indicum]
MTYIVNHLYIFLSILFAVTSQLVIKWKMNEYDLTQYPSIIEKFSFAFSMLFNPYIILSIFLTLLSGLSWMIAMTKFDISYAYPFTALGFVFILIFSALLFHEPITWHKFIGILLITSGILITSKSI